MEPDGLIVNGLFWDGVRPDLTDGPSSTAEASVQQPVRRKRWRWCPSGSSCCQWPPEEHGQRRAELTLHKWNLTSCCLQVKRCHMHRRKPSVSQGFMAEKLCNGSVLTSVPKRATASTSHVFVSSDETRGIKHTTRCTLPYKWTRREAAPVPDVWWIPPRRLSMIDSSHVWHISAISSRQEDI